MSPPQPDSSPRRLAGRSLLLAAFFLSGTTSLILEVVWTRILSLAVGATAPAMGAVLAAFMGGMAIGSALTGHRLVSRRDPVLTYALLEGWVGLYTLATPLLLGKVTVASPAIQLALAVALLLPATVPMGATLPVLCRALGKDSPWPAVEVGRLYAANTAGAVTGPLLCVFWLFPAFGLAITLGIVAIVDLAVFTALVVGRAAFPAWAPSDGEAASRKGSEPDRPHGLLIIALGVSGATAMVYEVAWMRTLSIVYGSSVYGVSIMLSTFLLGLAGGSALASSILRRRGRPASYAATGWLLAGSAGTAFISLFVARSLPFLFVSLYRSFPERDITLFFSQFIISAPLMLPGTLCLGAMLPVTTSASMPTREDIGRYVSWLYGGNLVGSTAGALVTSALVIGRLGVDMSVRAACALALGVALVMIGRVKAQFSAGRVSALAAAMLFVLGLDPSGGPVAKGFGFYSEPRAYTQYDLQRLRNLVAAHQLLYYRDGPTATVSVQKIDRYLLLMINGKTDASNGPSDTETQVLVGHLPLMAADAKRVALIGWGCGMTAGAILTHPVETIDAFEIEPAVVEASRFFDKDNGRPLDDARLRLILGDARSQLRQGRDPYDLIISQPSNPWITGVSNLFTRDFFELAASRLKPDGILCQWFHLYGMSEASTRTLLSTFRAVFPHTLVFRDRNLLLLGSRRPIRFSIPWMAELFRQPQIRENLSRALVRYPFDLLVQLRLDEQGAGAFSRGAPINTDDNLLLELAAPRSLYRDEIEAIRAELARHSGSIVDYLTGYPSLAWVHVEMASSLFTAGRTEEALGSCRRSLELEATFEAQKLLGQILDRMGRVEDARTALEEALVLGGPPEGRRFVEALLRSLPPKAAP